MRIFAIMGVKKYFIAIVIPEPLQQEIETIKQDLFKNFGLKGALRSPAHITLHRPFEWKEEKEEQMVEKLTAFQFDQKFDLQIKDYAYFEPRVIYANVLKNEMLCHLHKELSQYAKRELRLFNETGDLRGFHPHITVAFRDLKKPVFYELQTIFKEKSISGNFEYCGFSLLKLEERWEEFRVFNK